MRKELGGEERKLIEEFADYVEQRIRIGGARSDFGYVDGLGI